MWDTCCQSRWEFQGIMWWLHHRQWTHETANERSPASIDQIWQVLIFFFQRISFSVGSHISDCNNIKYYVGFPFVTLLWSDTTSVLLSFARGKDSLQRFLCVLVKNLYQILKICQNWIKKLLPDPKAKQQVMFLHVLLNSSGVGYKTWSMLNQSLLSLQKLH